MGEQTGANISFNSFFITQEKFNVENALVRWERNKSIGHVFAAKILLNVLPHRQCYFAPKLFVGNISARWVLNRINKIYQGHDFCDKNSTEYFITERKYVLSEEFKNFSAKKSHTHQFMVQRVGASLGHWLWLNWQSGHFWHQRSLVRIQ